MNERKNSDFDSFKSIIFISIIVRDMQQQQQQQHKKDS